MDQTLANLFEDLLRASEKVALASQKFTYITVISDLAPVVKAIHERKHALQQMTSKY